MVGLAKKIADPLQFLVETQLCAYPSVRKLIIGLPLDDQQREKLLVELHRFEHALLAEGFKLYSAVGREVGAQVLSRVIETIAEEYPEAGKKMEHPSRAGLATVKTA